MAPTVNEQTLRAWWSHRQGLDGALAGRSPAEVLAQAGWARSVGGASPYLALFARAGVSRSAVDAAVANIQIHELPSARGCTYVVPASDYSLALQVGQGEPGDMATARKLGVTDAEIDRLCAAVANALDDQPLMPDALRDAVSGAARSLGPEGVKKGLASTLPLALGRLQMEGEIRRIPVNGRLDQQRYRYERWKPNPLEGCRRTREEAFRELAARFFRWIGPATPAEFQWFSGLGARAARSTVADLGLVPLAPGDERLMFEDDRAALLAFKRPAKPAFVLTGSLDNISHLRRNVKDLVDAGDSAQQAPGQKDVSNLGGLSDFPDHVMLDRGRLVGLWEFDPESGTIAWFAFDGAEDSRLQEAVTRMEAFVAGDLGDARSFSLDSPKSRAPKIAAIRKAAKARGRR